MPDVFLDLPLSEQAEIIRIAAPKGELKASLEHDYRAMIESGMFTGDPAPFEKVIESLEKLERRINKIT